VWGVFQNTYHDRRLATSWLPRSPHLNTLDFYMWGHLKPLWTQLMLKTIALWMPVRLFPACRTFLNGCGGPRWDMSRRASNLMEDISSTYYKCTLSGTTHKLNVSGHLLIQTFILVLYVELAPSYRKNSLPLRLLCSHVIQNTRQLEECVVEGLKR
jgi:hypothetical protein